LGGIALATVAAVWWRRSRRASGHSELEEVSKPSDTQPAKMTSILSLQLNQVETMAQQQPTFFPARVLLGTMVPSGIGGDAIGATTVWLQGQLLDGGASEHAPVLPGVGNASSTPQHSASTIQNELALLRGVCLDVSVVEPPLAATPQHIVYRQTESLATQLNHRAHLVNKSHSMQFVDFVEPLAAVCTAVTELQQRGLCLPWVTASSIVQENRRSPWKLRACGLVEIDRVNKQVIAMWKRLPGSRWAAPELLRQDGQWLPASVVYSLGTVLWEILCNCSEAPFAGHTLEQA
jgi:hypothetical protein